MMIITAVILYQICQCFSQKHFQEQFSWKTIDYDFTTYEDRKIAINLRSYIPGNSLISSIEKYEDKLYLAVPRLKEGVPSTLNYISVADVDTKSPRLKPYPSWEWNDLLNKTSKNKKIISAVCLKSDICNRLWVLDTGTMEELKSKKSESNPSLFIFDLRDNKLMRRYVLPEEDYTFESKFRNIVVEINHSNCMASYAYLADAASGLVVYSWEFNKSYRIKHNYFSFEPIWGLLKSSDGKDLQLNDGLQSMTLSQVHNDGYRDLLFHPLIGINQFSVNTKILRNKTLATQNITDFKFLGDRGIDMQSSASILDQETGVLFYTAFVKNAITCWNSFRGEEFSSKRHGIIEEFHHPNSYPADIKLDSNGTLWVLTNHFLNFVNEAEQNRIPYRIYTGIPRQIIRGSVCDEL